MRRAPLDREAPTSARTPDLAIAALAAGACLAGWGCGAEPAGAPPPRHVLLISLDTLRADHTGFGGYSKPTTPFLDSLAQRALVFDNHFSNANCTLPSHATMLTGLHYPSHGVRPDEDPEAPIRPLSPTIVTLAERFQEGGYSTAAFTSHGAWLNEDYGFDQGFDHFLGRWADAEGVMRKYVELLEEGVPERSFTFLHFFDIHSDFAPSGPCLPYQADPQLVARFAGEAPEDFTGCSLGEGRCSSDYLIDLSHGKEPVVDEHLDYLVGLYDAGIRQMDDQLRLLFRLLGERGLLEDTLIVVTSDHGESFYEHQTMLHDTHHDEVARVPLLMLLPERFGVAPRRVQALTQSTDLAPTILELCGLEPIGQLSSLAPALMTGEEPEDGFVLINGHIVIGRDELGEYKLVNSFGRLEPRSFYDRSADPDERYNLHADEEFVAREGARLEAVSERLNLLLAECRGIHRLLDDASADGGARLSPERIRELQKLGYLGGGPDESDGE